jgi:hypothetical protein
MYKEKISVQRMKRRMTPYGMRGGLLLKSHISVHVFLTSPLVIAPGAMAMASTYVKETTQFYLGEIHL